MRQVEINRKNERLVKVLALAIEKGMLTNNSVQSALGVSDATATNYLRELVKEGKLKRTGVRAGTRYWLF